MNQGSEIEYLILEKQSYKKDLNRNETDLTLSALAFFASAITIVRAIALGPDNSDTFIGDFYNAIPYISTGIAGFSIKNLADAISEKAKLGIKIEDIDKKIEELNLEGENKIK